MIMYFGSFDPSDMLLYDRVKLSEYFDNSYRLELHDALIKYLVRAAEGQIMLHKKFNSCTNNSLHYITLVFTFFLNYLLCFSINSFIGIHSTLQLEEGRVKGLVCNGQKVVG